MEVKPKSKNSEEEIKYTYENCWKFIIRPPRDEYILSELDLPPSLFDNQDISYTREDFTVLSKRGYLMLCSFYRTDISEREPYIRPVVIYLHGNSSCRVEGAKMALFLLNKGIDLFVFDFPGCGKSEGEYISLGYYEKEDVRSIVDFIEKFPGVGKIGIWGRSMGAATSLMYSYTDERIKAQCIDSPFAIFRDLAIKLCKKYVYIPEFIINTIFYFIKKTIRKKIDLDLENLKPIDFVHLSKTPAFFIHAMKDDLIPYEHTIQLYEKYAGIKSINIIEGDHNSPRQRHLINKIISFFLKYLDENYKEDNNIEEYEESEECFEDEDDIKTNVNDNINNTLISEIQEK
jgi:pimeloyl-ACP methyl ester carboxylesterase